MDTLSATNQKHRSHHLSNKSANFKHFEQRSERVKCVDLHPTEPWQDSDKFILRNCVYLELPVSSKLLCLRFTCAIMAAMFQSRAYHYCLELEKSFKLTESPVRSAKFIACKQWFVAGADDKCMHVYNYDTEEEIKEFEAHTDYIRSVAVHPTLPYVLSSSDDKLIKLWDWEKDWVCAQIFEGHSHYVMQVAFNPRDTSTFASVSLDCSLKLWNLGSSNPNLTLEAHSKGINCVDFIAAGDKPHLITGSDDQTVKVWDYETETCVQTLEGHEHNVTAVCVHPEAPIIITGSEDMSIRIWHAKTYRLENTVNYELGRVWYIGCMKSSPQIAIGCDEGTIMGNVLCSHSWDTVNLQDQENVSK
ncbi:hypothetical protein RJ640_005890 [Escallonia rubra]|uniref:Beta'-coat protein n=1 Tax=Escallonia rubra TaxID=112253 RepID=A0AA88QFG2_9ASTE|nr:hypothetical protein RJ640_005890 [Escallonia rubra]